MKWIIIITLAFVLFITLASASSEPAHCPAGTYQQGMDKNTGALVCKPDNLTDPSESNYAPVNVNKPPQDVDIAPVNVEGFTGK